MIENIDKCALVNDDASYKIYFYNTPQGLFIFPIKGEEKLSFPWEKKNQDRVKSCNKYIESFFSNNKERTQQVCAQDLICEAIFGNSQFGEDFNFRVMDFFDYWGNIEDKSKNVYWTSTLKTKFLNDEETSPITEQKDETEKAIDNLILTQIQNRQLTYNLNNNLHLI